MEYKIEIPDGYELIKTDSGYAVRKKDNEKPPRSWAEFCERYPLKEEAFIDSYSNIKDVVLDLEEFYKLKYCSTVVYMVPRA